jgi:hypothetical protein
MLKEYIKIGKYIFSYEISMIFLIYVRQYKLYEIIEGTLLFI